MDYLYLIIFYLYVAKWKKKKHSHIQNIFEEDTKAGHKLARLAWIHPSYASYSRAAPISFGRSPVHFSLLFLYFLFFFFTLPTEWKKKHLLPQFWRTFVRSTCHPISTKVSNCSSHFWRLMRNRWCVWVFFFLFERVEILLRFFIFYLFYQTGWRKRSYMCVYIIQRCWLLRERFFSVKFIDSTTESWCNEQAYLIEYLVLQLLFFFIFLSLSNGETSFFFVH